MKRLDPINTEETVLYIIQSNLCSKKSRLMVSDKLVVVIANVYGRLCVESVSEKPKKRIMRKGV